MTETDQDAACVRKVAQKATRLEHQSMVSVLIPRIKFYSCRGHWGNPVLPKVSLNGLRLPMFWAPRPIEIGSKSDGPIDGNVGCWRLRRPLQGVPIVVKEAFEYPGFPYTNGLLSRKGRGKNEGLVPGCVVWSRHTVFVVLKQNPKGESPIWRVSQKKHAPHNWKKTPLVSAKKPVPGVVAPSRATESQGRLGVKAGYAVQRVEAAGFLVLATTNISEARGVIRAR